MQNAPVLLVPNSSIPADVQTELDRLNPAHIYVVGGTATISADVQAQLAGFIG